MEGDYIFMAMCLPMNANVHQNAIYNANRSKRFITNGNTIEIQQRNLESIGSRLEGEIICILFEAEFYSEEII